MNDTIKKILIDAFDEVSPLLSDIISYSDDLVLWGISGIFDSLGLVNFISTVESLVSERLDKNIMIVSEKAFSTRNSPFKSMESLGTFIEELLGEPK
jgi:hypothetical protein